jgi:uncharacterized protein
MFHGLKNLVFVALVSALAFSGLIAPQVAFAIKPPAPAPSTAGPGAGAKPGDPLFGYIDATPAGTVSWSTLSKAKTVQKADKKLGPLFTQDIKDLDKQELKFYGFMMPLDGGSAKQKRFLLTAWPPHCGFCMPGGPEMMIEVVAEKPIEYSMEPMVVSGKFAVLENDVVYYRLINAKQVKLN